MRALILSLSTARAAQVRSDVDRLLGEGYEVDLIATKDADWSDLPAAVHVQALSDAERSHPVLRAERFLVLSLPRMIYTLVARILALAARVLPGKIGRRVARLGGSWKKRWVIVRESTRHFHKERWGKAYGYVRPWFLWRAARRHALPNLAGGWDVIVVADALSTPIGWKLARQLPDAAVGFSLEEALSDNTDEP